MTVTTLIDAFFQKLPAGNPGGITRQDAEFLSGLVEKIKPASILEIGCAAGVSASVIQMTCLSDPALSQINFASYDIVARWYKDNAKPTGYLVDEYLEEPLAGYRLFTTPQNWHKAVAYFTAQNGRRLVFIDARHIHPFPAMDTMKVMDLLQDGDYIAYHDVGPDHADLHKNGEGAAVIWKAYPVELKNSLPSAPNIGAVRYERATMTRVLNEVLKIPFEKNLSRRDKRDLFFLKLKLTSWGWVSKLLGY